MLPNCTSANTHNTLGGKRGNEMLFPSILFRCKKTRMSDNDEESTCVPTTAGSVGTLGARGFESSDPYSGHVNIWSNFATSCSSEDKQPNSSSISDKNISMSTVGIVPDNGSDGREGDKDADLLTMIYENCTTELPSPTNCAAGNILPTFIPDLSIIDEESTRAGMTTVATEQTNSDLVEVRSRSGRTKKSHMRAEKEARKRLLKVRK